MSKLKVGDTVSCIYPPWREGNPKNKVITITSILPCSTCSNYTLCPGRVNGECFGYSKDGREWYCLTLKNGLEGVIDREVARLKEGN